MGTNSTVDRSAHTPQMRIFATHAIEAAEHVGIGQMIEKPLLRLAHATAKQQLCVQPSVATLGSSTTARPSSTLLSAGHVDKVRPAPPAPRFFANFSCSAPADAGLLSGSLAAAAHCSPVCTCASRCAFLAPSAHAPTTL
jgi:hypothetical protein